MPSLCQVTIRSVCVGTATSMVDDSHVLGISLALVHRAQGLESLNPQLLLGEFGSVHQQYTKTERIMGNANPRIVLTEVRSCTELPFCHVKQHSTSISLLGWRDLHELCNFYKSQADATHPVAALGLLTISVVHIHLRSLRKYRQLYHFS